MTAGPAVPRPVTPIGIAAARLRTLSDTLDGAGADEARALAELVGGLDDYLERTTDPQTPARARLAARTAEHDWGPAGLEQEMLSGNVEAQTLAMLVRATRARRVLEVGTFTGYSALAMAEALPPDGLLVTCEQDETAAALARDAFADSPAGARIELRVGAAAASLDALAAGGASFDLVFVDADKAGYRGYVDTLLDTGLLAEHGLLCVDNTLMQGQPWTGATTANGRAIAAFNQWLTDDPRVRQVIVPVRDGLTLACRVAGP